jgi:hypothetical protein
MESDANEMKTIFPKRLAACLRARYAHSDRVHNHTSRLGPFRHAVCSLATNSIVDGEDRPDPLGYLRCKHLMSATAKSNRNAGARLDLPSRYLVTSP